MIHKAHVFVVSRDMRERSMLLFGKGGVGAWIWSIAKAMPFQDLKSQQSQSRVAALENET